MKNCGHIFYLESDSAEPNDWFQVGRLFQKIGLITEKNNFCLQPIAYNLIAFNHIYEPKLTLLCKEEYELIESTSSKARQTLNIDFKKAGILFRLGRSLHETVMTPRRKVEVIIDFANSCETIKAI